MNLAIILKLVHVACAFWFVSGIIGRAVTLALAAKSDDVRAIAALDRLTGQFERGMVIPGSGAVFLAGLVTAWLQNWPILGFLQGGAVNWVLVSVLLFLSNVPLIIWVYNPRGIIFGAALQASIAQGAVTPELRAAYRDRVVAAAHAYEIAIIIVVAILMVLKPF